MLTCNTLFRKHYLTPYLSLISCIVYVTYNLFQHENNMTYQRSITNRKAIYTRIYAYIYGYILHIFHESHNYQLYVQTFISLIFYLKFGSFIQFGKKVFFVTRSKRMIFLNVCFKLRKFYHDF